MSVPLLRIAFRRPSEALAATILLWFFRPVVIQGPLPVKLDPASDECCDPMITNAISENEAVPVCQE